MLHRLTDVPGAGGSVGIAGTGGQAVGAVFLHDALAIQIVGQEHRGIRRGRLDGQLNGVTFLNMDGIGPFDAAGICMADLYRNILIVKVCVQDCFRTGQRIIAHTVDLGIVPAAAGGVCAAIGIRTGEIEGRGLPVHPNIVIRGIPVKAGRCAAGGHKGQRLVLGGNGKAGQVQLTEQLDGVLLIIGSAVFCFGNADCHRLAVTCLGHGIGQILGKSRLADRRRDRYRLCKVMGLRDGALGLIQSRHGPFCRGLHGNRTVAVGHRIVVGVVGGREGLVGGVGDPAGSVGAIIEGQTGQPVGGDRLRDRHIQSTGSREGDLRVIPGILRGDAGIAFAGDQMIGPIHRCDLGASSVENLHRCAGGNGQRHRHGSDLLNVKGVGTLLSVGSRDLNRVILRVSGQLHRPGPGDGVILPERLSGNLQRGGNGRQAVLPYSRLEIQRQLGPFRRSSQRFQRGDTGHGNIVGLDLRVSVCTGILGFQSEGLALHTGGKQISKRRGRAVPAAGQIGHILAVGAGIDGAELGGLGIRDIAHRRIQIHAAQGGACVLNPILRRMVRLILLETIGFFLRIQQPDIAEPLAVGQGHGDLCISGDRQCTVRAVMAAVGYAELVVAGNDLGAAGAGGDVAIGIRQGNDRFRHSDSVLSRRCGDGVLGAVQKGRIFGNGIFQGLQQRPCRVGSRRPQALQRRCIGIGRCRIILHMVGHVQVIRHLEDQLDGIIRIRRRYVEAKGLNGRSRSVQLVAAFVIIEQIVGGNAVDLINESLLQADKFNI